MDFLVSRPETFGPVAEVTGPQAYEKTEVDPMLTPEQIQTLQESCSDIANSNWDGFVEVTQDENGVLTFTSFNEDEEQEAQAVATPCNHQFEGRDLYRLRDADDPESVGAITTLVPVFIVGYLGL